MKKQLYVVLPLIIVMSATIAVLIFAKDPSITEKIGAVSS